MNRLERRRQAKIDAANERFARAIGTAAYDLWWDAESSGGDVLAALDGSQIQVLADWKLESLETLTDSMLTRVLETSAMRLTECERAAVFAVAKIEALRRARARAEAIVTFCADHIAIFKAGGPHDPGA